MKTHHRNVGLLAACLLPAVWPADASAIGFSISFRGAPVWVPPVYEARERIITEPAVWEEQPTRVWREPRYEIRTVRVEIPAQVQTRRVPEYNRRGRIIGFRMVEDVIRPARIITRDEKVLVSEGRYETITQRNLIRPERQRRVYEEVLLRPGHWAHPRVAYSHGRPHVEHIRVVEPQQRPGVRIQVDRRDRD